MMRFASPVAATAAFLLCISGPGSLAADVTATLQALPHTDGSGLPPPAQAMSPTQWPRLLTESRLACKGPCETPFGALLGVADDAPARSNCVSTCVHPERSFLDLASGALLVGAQAGEPRAGDTSPDAGLENSPEAGNGANGGLHYVGITYQCVGYARLWWMKNRGLTFGDVDIAHDILYLTEASDVRSGESVPLGRSLNGTARRAPERGDLVVYLADHDDPQWRAGHVAVVVAVNPEQGWVALAEENYDNRPWEDPLAFARRIPLFQINGRYSLLDVPADSRANARGGRIAGWVYPLP